MGSCGTLAKLEDGTPEPPDPPFHSAGDLSAVTYTGSKMKGRPQVVMLFYDSWDRMNETAAVGTNGGSDLDRDSPGSITRSDTMLVTTTSFDDAGRAYEVSDPRSIETRTLFDDAGRRIATVANYVNGTPSSSTGDDDVYTRYVYDDGHMTQMWVDIDGDGVQDAGTDQVTTYTYGVPKGGSAGQSNLASNSLLYTVTYPDSSGGSDLVTLAYNALGQEMWKSDQLGTVMQTDYDTAGRVTQKRATTVGTGLDTTTRRIATTYESRGLMELITQYNNATVKNQSNTTVAEYSYNGLGHRIRFLQDTDSDGDADAFDFTFYIAYDDAWRIVATFRHTDTSPKEQFLNHNAGLGGYGGATGGIGGYIDHVVMRDKDANTAWTTTSDGTLEERRYSCQNWRADASALVTSAGKLVESIKHSSYGVETGLPGGDTDSDGDWDATDSSYVTGVSAYEVRKDPELDNDADAADVTFANSVKGTYQTLGRNVLSSTAVGNRKGYGGYEYDVYITSLSHVRFRVFNNILERWTKRDPTGYFDGANTYLYAMGIPIRMVDPLGLAACGWPCSTQHVDFNIGLSLNPPVQVGFMFDVSFTGHVSGEYAHCRGYCCDSEGEGETWSLNVAAVLEFRGTIGYGIAIEENISRRIALSLWFGVRGGFQGNTGFTLQTEWARGCGKDNTEEREVCFIVNGGAIAEAGLMIRIDTPWYSFQVGGRGWMEGTCGLNVCATCSPDGQCRLAKAKLIGCQASIGVEVCTFLGCFTLQRRFSTY